MSLKVSTSDLDQLRIAVTHAFADVQPPPTGESIVLCPCEECQSVRHNLTLVLGSHWAEMPNEIIDSLYDKLPFLLPEAFRYCLPAFMIRSMDDWGQSDVWEFTVYALCPSEKYTRHAGAMERWWRSRLALFSGAQMGVINSFLDLVMTDMQRWRMWTVADEGKRMLAQYRSDSGEIEDSESDQTISDC